jgi:hypothetical protein
LSASPGYVSANSLVGQVDRCFHDAGTGFLQHADDAFLGLGPGAEFTMTGWLKGIGWGYSSAILYSKWDAVNKDWALYITDDGVTFHLKFSVYDINDTLITADYSLPVASRPPDFSWTFVSFGYNAAIQKIWVQLNANTIVAAVDCAGIRRTPAAFALADIVNTGDIVPSASSIGDYDETAFWRRSLTQTEIELVHNTGLAGQPLSSLF